MTKQDLNTLAGLFGRCFVVAIVLQAISTGLWLLVAQWAIEFNANLFAVEPDQVRLAAFYFFAAWKVLNITLFFVPWAALKLKAAGME
ncbi:MAG: hypothetical protein KDA37_02805 [Planctomycetales bacterium]|nr:hypothetical protein [Planctomycetales bacterium]